MLHTYTDGEQTFACWLHKHTHLLFIGYQWPYPTLCPMIVICMTRRFTLSHKHMITHFTCIRYTVCQNQVKSGENKTDHWWRKMTKISRYQESIHLYRYHIWDIWHYTLLHTSYKWIKFIETMWLFKIIHHYNIFWNFYGVKFSYKLGYDM